MGILSTLKSVFLPSAQTAADRRLATFGTTSKLPAIGAAIVAGVVVATPFLREAALATIVKHPVATVLGTAVVAGGGLQLVKPAYTTTKKATERAVPVLLGEKEVTPESIKDVLKVAGIIAGAGIVGTGAGIIASKIMDEDKPLQTETPLIPSTTTGTILPATTTISDTPRRYKRGKAKQIIPSMKQSINLVISNRAISTGIANKRYINERVYA